MKYLIYLTALVTAGIALLMPSSVDAQTVVNQGLPPGYSTTTIYVPSTQTTTTTTTIVTPISTNSYSGVNQFAVSNDSFYIQGFYGQPDRQFARPTQFIQQYNGYPGAIESRCSTSVIGSPIASVVPFDRFTGQPCR